MILKIYIYIYEKNKIFLGSLYRLRENVFLNL